MTKHDWTMATAHKNRRNKNRKRISEKKVKPVKKENPVNKTILNNGIRILTEEVESVESFSLGIFITAGSRDDFKAYEGMAHLLEHVTFRSCKNGTSRQVAAKFESVGAHLNAYTTKEFTCYHVRALKSNVKKIFNLLADVALNGNFTQKEIDAEKPVVIDEIRYYNDDPEETAAETADKALFPGHSLGVPVAGYEDSVKRISEKELKEFYNKFYSPENIIIAASGNIRHDKMTSLAEQLFADKVPSGSESGRTVPDEIESPVAIEKTYPSQQVYWTYGHRMPGINSRFRIKVKVLDELFAGSMSSRLQYRLREKEALTYNIESEMDMFSDSGAYYINCSYDPDLKANIPAIIFAEMEKILTGKISGAELQRAKEQIKSGLVMEMESMSARMDALVSAEVNTYGPAGISDIIREVEGVTREDIVQAAGVIFDRSNAVIVKLVPENKSK